MTLTDTAPYAPAASVIKVLETYRETGLGGQINAAQLARLTAALSGQLRAGQDQRFLALGRRPAYIQSEEASHG